MSANEDYAKWCVDRLKQNEDLCNAFFPDYVHHTPIITQDMVYGEEEMNCTEDIGDDN